GAGEGSPSVAAGATASAKRVLDKLASVASREIYQGLSAEMRCDPQTARRHFLAAAQSALALSEAYAATDEFGLSLRRRKDAVSCFWRAGYVVQARLLWEELRGCPKRCLDPGQPLRQENDEFAQDMNAIVLDFEHDYRGWGPS